MFTIEKNGGTSMSALNDVIKNIILFECTGDKLYNRIFVVSAFLGVTDMLLENKNRIARYQDFHKPLKVLIAAHRFRNG